MGTQIMRGRRLATVLTAVVFGIAAALLLGPDPARASGGALSQADQQCLDCHSAEGLEKELANGEKLSLHVEGGAFAKSAHSMLGCAVCHADVTLKNHPPLERKIASIRENSLALTKVCRSCHAETYKLYDSGTHAALVREGNPAAPVCSDCHSPHAVVLKAGYDATTGAPCSKCHDSVFNAYSGSVHGQARKQGRAEAPLCSTCHGSHDVSASAAEDGLKNTCLGCHSGASQAHQSWLPNAERHLRTVSCAACHAPGAKRKVDLRLYDSEAQKRIAEKEGVPQFESRARAMDTEGKGLNGMALQSLLREFSRDGMEGKVTLRGRLEVASGEEAHGLADKAKAVRQCESCHRAGSDPFQSVTISITGPDGRPLRYDAQREVLSSAISVDSIGGFYVIGATRIRLLDMLVALALLVGVGVPIVHLTLGWLSRRYARKIGGREDS